MTSLLILCAWMFHGEARDLVVLESQQARLAIDLGGGAIGEFRLKGSDLNPLAWGTPQSNDEAIHGYGHFLCLDRWGPPSKAEGERGMPYHGEAANVRWSRLGTSSGPEILEAQMEARLPKAGLTVRRTVRLSSTDPVFTVLEEVTNENALGRLYNIVQHPTIAPPFLDESTIVDCNGRRGFAQGGSLPNPEVPSAMWPMASQKGGGSVDLRFLTSAPEPNVVSFEIADELGWITAANPRKGLLIGYVWSTSDYPWVSVWRDVQNGKPAARGLEFGSTGLHQPFPILVEKGKIWDRQLMEYLDAGQTKAKSYAGFLLKIPADFTGVKRISREGERLVIADAMHSFTVSLQGLAVLKR